ncbi:MAG: VTT domain-containing protein [Patescibacteria group bacterium]
MQIDPQLLQSLEGLEEPIVFVGSFLFGETVILSGSYLAGQGVWSVVVVYIWALLGTLAADAAWFYLGPKGLRLMHRWEKVKHKHEAIIAALQRHVGDKPFLAMLFIKFLYGTRILTIIYLSSVKVRFWTFMLFDLIGTAVWLVVMVGVGWLAGKGLADVLPAVRSVEYLLTGIVALMILFKLLTTWLEKRIAKKL